MDNASKAPEKPYGVKDLPTGPVALLGVLKELGIGFKIHNHPPIFTVAEGAHLKESIPGTHCRNLFLCDKKKAMTLVVAANETKVDLKALEAKLGCARLSFGSPDRLWTYLGIFPGAVCPFAMINDKNHEIGRSVFDDLRGLFHLPRRDHHAHDADISLHILRVLLEDMRI